MSIMKDVCDFRSETNSHHDSASRLCSNEAFELMRGDSLSRVRLAAQLPSETKQGDQKPGEVLSIPNPSTKDLSGGSKVIDIPKTIDGVPKATDVAPPNDGASKATDGNPKAPDAPIGPSRKALEPVTDPKILNDVGKRRDGSKIEPLYIGVDNSASYLGDDGKKHIATGVPAWLDRPAAEAFVRANEKLAALGKRIEIASESGADNAINSAGRTHTQQRIASGIHARPGNSVHEVGRGLDVRNFDDPEVKAALKEAGFVQGNLRKPNVPIKGDAWHFSYAGPPGATKHEQSQGHGRGHGHGNGHGHGQSHKHKHRH